MMDAIRDFRRDVLVSIRPFYASKILDGRKTVELRRKFPEVASTGAMALIYSSSPVSAIVGYARIKFVLKLPVSQIWKDHGDAACISKENFDAYFAGLKYGFAIVLESPKLLKRQLTAIDLADAFGIVPPQSYRYLTSECFALVSDGRLQTTHRHKRTDWARRRPARSGVSR
jgi:predicted transcriptional regulator